MIAPASTFSSHVVAAPRQGPAVVSPGSVDYGPRAMAEPSLSPDALRAAAEELSHTPDDDRIDRVAEVVADALIDQAQHRALTPSPSVVDARVAALKLKPDDGATTTGRPLEIVRGGARNPAERALLAALVAWHLETLLGRRDGVHAVRSLVPALDWLEFVGHAPPYTAARETLDADVIARLDAVLEGAPIEAATPAAAAAIRALRGQGARGARPRRPRGRSCGRTRSPSPESWRATSAVACGGCSGPCSGCARCARCCTPCSPCAPR